MELPQEIEWNIIKFMRHPIADMHLMENSECFVDEDEVEDETLASSWFRRKKLNQNINYYKSINDKHFLYRVKDQMIQNAYAQYCKCYPG